MKKVMIVLCTACALSATATTRAQWVLAHDWTQGGPAAVLSDLELSAWTIPLQGQVVKGVPYSAEIVSESIQTLADGNRIVQRKTGRVYRDGQGRMRREDDRPSGGPAVSITDPVAGTAFTLDPASRTARETPVMSFNLSKSDIGLYRLWIDPYAISGQAGLTYSYSVGGVPQQAPGVRARRAAGGGDYAEEKLPDRNIEGVLATGVRRTTTIAKGAIGNELPIKIVSEEWTSPELQVLVMTDHLDPRTGRSTYQLLKISRLEPDAALFQVPPGYTVERLAGKGRGRGRGQ
jgi:hypothetical protein